jgi:uncharacterized protein (TIGR02118 family)
MAVKLVVLYAQPDDADAFDRHYFGTHMALVAQVPGLQRTETARVVAPLDGGEQSVYRVTELYFADQAAMDADCGSDQGGGHRGRLPEDRPARVAHVRRGRRQLIDMTHKKIAITLPEEQVAAARQAVALGLAPSVSAYISQALRRRDADDELQEMLAEVYAQTGPPTDADRAWARHALGLDA